MGLFSKKTEAAQSSEKASPSQSTPTTQTTPANASEASLPAQIENTTVQGAEDEGKVTALACILGAIASLGGLMFGYESGQISGKSSVLLASSNSEG